MDIRTRGNENENENVNYVMNVIYDRVQQLVLYITSFLLIALTPWIISKIVSLLRVVCCVLNVKYNIYWCLTVVMIAAAAATTAATTTTTIYLPIQIN